MHSTEGGWPALALSFLYELRVLKWSRSTFTLYSSPCSWAYQASIGDRVCWCSSPEPSDSSLCCSLSWKDAETVRQAAWTSLKESSHTYQARQSWGNTSAFQTQRQPRHYPCGMIQWLIPHSVWPRTGYPFMNCVVYELIFCEMQCALCNVWNLILWLVSPFCNFIALWPRQHVKSF